MNVGNFPKKVKTKLVEIQNGFEKPLRGWNIKIKEQLIYKPGSVPGQAGRLSFIQACRHRQALSFYPPARIGRAALKRRYT